MSQCDQDFMKAALLSAAQNRAITPPNPCVGALIVKDGQILASGATEKTGERHAEIVAIEKAQKAGFSLEGATLYVTLEPCSHYGRTPPCALRVIKEKFTRVVVATLDPNPLVAGRGIKMLKEAGIEVLVGVLEKEARESLLGFLHRFNTGRPWVRLKMAATLDAKSALEDGRSEWITGEGARQDGQRWRSYAGAILTGIGTVEADDPQMNVRLPGVDRQPLRVVIDRDLKMSESAKILSSEGGRVILVAAHDPKSRKACLEALGACVWFMPDKDNENNVDLEELLTRLAKEQVNEVHLEAGARLSSAFLKAGLVDELLLYYAPCFFGQGRAMFDLPTPESPNAAPRWTICENRVIENDLCLRLRRK